MGRRARIEVRNARYCFGRAVDKGGRATCALGILNMTSYCASFALRDGKGIEQRAKAWAQRNERNERNERKQIPLWSFRWSPSTRAQKHTAHRSAMRPTTQSPSARCKSNVGEHQKHSGILAFWRSGILAFCPSSQTRCAIHL